jgi:hypothetical protein
MSPTYPTSVTALCDKSPKLHYSANAYTNASPALSSFNGNIPTSVFRAKARFPSHTKTNNKMDFKSTHSDIGTSSALPLNNGFSLGPSQTIQGHIPPSSLHDSTSLHNSSGLAKSHWFIDNPHQ